MFIHSEDIVLNLLLQTNVYYVKKNTKMPFEVEPTEYSVISILL